MTKIHCCIVGVFTLYCMSAFSAELYRYQDSKGRWGFGDKKSMSDKSKVDLTIEKITIEDHRIKQPKPDISVEKIRLNGRLSQRRWTVSNPLPVTIQHWIAIKGQSGFMTSILSKPYEDAVFTSDDFEVSEQSQLNHFYLLGEPIDKPATQIIAPPYAQGKQFRISQGFNGKFSHSGRGNRYALDIAMPIGEPILAIKSGIVADARDGFSMGGAANYFLDKANHVTVMHDDGSYGIYAHILYGSLAVEVGQKVVAGQSLARIGSTGYSTGPHLHFVLRYNSGRGAYSIPFKFKTEEGQALPRDGRYYSGLLKKLDK